MLAREAARSFFEGQESGESTLPTFHLTQSQVKDDLNVMDLFKLAGLTNSNGETRRLIQGKGARLNDQLVEDESHKITLNDFQSPKGLKISAGKKRHLMVKVL